MPEDHPGPHAGHYAELWTIANDHLRVAFTTYGARLVSLEAPDASGSLANVVLGYNSLELYIADKTFFGATIGRFANRIANGRFTLAGTEYSVPANNGPNALHGGPHGFDRHLWHATPIPSGVEFTLTSPAGDQGFPGTLTATARYTLEGPTLRAEFTATTDATTIVNLTNHAYFNLSGARGEPNQFLSETILDHIVTIPAPHYTPVTESLIPTGELAPTANTPFDLTHPTRIGDHIDAEHPQLNIAGGYDHNYVFAPSDKEEIDLAATVTDPLTHRTLTVHTTQPGMQFYTGNSISPASTSGLFTRRSGFCLETQHFPDSPNHPAFPTTTLHPGEAFRATTTFTFGVS